MRFYFPCAKGTRAIGHGEVMCGKHDAPKLPKSFSLRNVSMAWERMLQETSLPGDWPSIHWRPHPQSEEALLNRGGSSANLTTLLAALHYTDPFCTQQLGQCQAIWASGELNPTTSNAFLLPVGEIETKVEYFLQQHSPQNPAIFVASIGNHPEIERLRQELPDTFDELRFRPAMDPLPTLQRPLILWLGCSLSDWMSFAHWLTQPPHTHRPLHTRLFSKQNALMAACTLLFLLLGALGSLASRYYFTQQALQQERKALLAERRAHKRTEGLLFRVQSLVTQISQTLKIPIDSQTQQKRLSHIHQRSLQTERSLRHLLRTSQYTKDKRRHNKRRSHRRLALLRGHQLPRELTPPPQKERTPEDFASVEKALQISGATLQALRCTFLQKRASQHHKGTRAQNNQRWHFSKILRGPTRWNQSGELGKVVFSPNGKMLATTDENRVVRIWQLRNGKLLFSLKGHRYALTDVAFSPTGRFLATASRDRTILLWSLKNGKLISRMKGHRGAVFDVMFLPYGLHLMSVGPQSIRSWSPQTGFPLSRTHTRWKWASLASLSPDGRWAITGDLRANGHIWNSRNGNRLALLRGHTQRIISASWAFDGLSVATASLDRTLRIWDVQTGQPLMPPLKQKTRLRSVSFSPNGLLLLASSRHSIQLWNTCSGRRLMHLSLPEHNLTFAAFSPDQRTIATTSIDGEITLYRRSYHKK